MLELSFIGPNQLIGINNNRLWKSLDQDTGNTLNKIINNSYLRNNIEFVKHMKCHGRMYAVKKYTHNKSAISVILYDLSNNRTQTRRNVITDPLDRSTEIYVPNILPNGRGIWLVSYQSPLARIDMKNSINKRIAFNPRTITKEGLVK